MRTLHYCAALLILISAASAKATDYAALDRAADEFDRIQIQPDGTLRKVDVVSREVNVPVPTLEQQRAQTRLGYGELLIANALANATGRSFDEIAAQKASGRGWGEIAREYNVNLGKIVSRTHHARDALRGSSKRDQKKAEKFVNGHDARDGKWDDGDGGGNGHGNGHGGGNGKGHGGGKGHGKH